MAVGILMPHAAGLYYPKVVMQTPVTINSDSTNYTFTAAAINCAVGDLVVIMDMNSSIGSAQSTSMTVGGNAMSPVKVGSNTSSSGAIYQWVATSALTTANVVSNHSSGSTRCSIVVFVISGLSSPTAVNSNVINNGSANNLTLPLTTKSGGIVIGSYQQNNGSGAACTWTGMTNLVKQVDVNQEGTATASVAIGTRVPVYTAQNINVACTAGAANACLIAASWR